MSSALQKYGSSAIATAPTRTERRLGRALERLEAEVRYDLATVQGAEMVATAQVAGLQNTVHAAMIGAGVLAHTRSTIAAGDPVLAATLNDYERLAAAGCGSIINGLATKYSRML